MGNTETLPYSDLGTIFIELEANVIGFIVGEKISGFVHLDLKKGLKCTHFTIKLIGYDVASYM